MANVKTTITKYVAKLWHALPSKKTPIDAEGLNNLEKGLERLTDEVGVALSQFPQEGVKGDKGDRGERGEKGEKGEQGEKGLLDIRNADNILLGSVLVKEANGWVAYHKEKFKAFLESDIE